MGINAYERAERAGTLPGDTCDCDAMRAVVRAAEALVAHIGCYGEIDSRHRLTLDCLEALIAIGKPQSPRGDL